MHLQMSQAVAHDRVGNRILRRHRRWSSCWSHYWRRWGNNLLYNGGLACDWDCMLCVRILPPSGERGNQTDDRERDPNFVPSLARIQRRIILFLSFAPRGDSFQFSAALFARFFCGSVAVGCALYRRNRIYRPPHSGRGSIFGCKEVGDGLVFVESQIFGVSADEPFVEDTARKFVEVFGLKRLEVALADLGGFCDLFQRHATHFALALDPFTERCHVFPCARDLAGGVRKS